VPAVVGFGGGDRMLYEVCYSSSNRGLYVTVHNTFQLLLSAIFCEIYLNNTLKFSSYLTRNTRCLHSNEGPVNAVYSRVKAGSNNSIVALRVVGGDEK
jgi:uncharacterized Zn-finger protein